MQNYHSAFLASEIIQLKDVASLQAIRHRYTSHSPLSLDTIMTENMSKYAGMRLQISALSFYHMGFVLYELQEIGGDIINGLWPEDALQDQELARAGEHEFFQLAENRYVAQASSDGELAEIRDRAGRLCCALRMRDVASGIENIERVARLRCSISFARRYNFEDESLSDDRDKN
ncbi:hypothetical protein [Persicirhabdus sediminis]|uniref:Uncharacterized protein n=1 Tax=Persicirhabdus sediminis TaxID=454144 RepID=A0A8J7MFD0_9BACT|nr:hypothetical protein [Persicirhabdus sediminis]MBK1791701.1 hypothetical protein [Persicirhabdus sediminis]